MTTATMPTVADYARIFEAERQNEYPVIDAFEARMGYAIDRAKLEQAARVLACPLKKNPPSWQHGRVIYAAARARFAKYTQEISFTALDIGTAKGFSALCLRWALNDNAAGVWAGSVYSVDVVDPDARARRNTVAETDGYLTLAETLAPWPEAEWVRFSKETGIEWLLRSGSQLGPIDVAFIDGKHTSNVVLQEGRYLADLQRKGDVAIFDDLQLIGPAVDELERKGLYAFERLWIKKDRGYAVGVRRG